MKVMLRRTLLMTLLVLALVGLMVIGVGAEALTGTYADDAAAVADGAVAKVTVDGSNATYYSTLAEAIADATDDAVVTLLADITDLGEPVKRDSTYCYIYVAEGKNITLDLNDCEIAVADPGVSSNGEFAVVYVKGSLTIQDSGAEQTGAIVVTDVTALHSSNSSAIENRGGTLTVNGGTIEHKGFNGSALGTFAIHNNTNTFGDASLTINGGNVIASEGSAIRLTTTSPVEAGSGATYFLMTGGSVVGKETGIWLMPANNRSDVEAIVSISGGTVTAEVDAFYTNFCTVDTKLSTTISGGTFNGTVQGKDGEIAIAGGTFNGEVVIKDGNKVPVEKTNAITGGSFNPPVNPDYLDFSDPATILVFYITTADGTTILSFNSLEDALATLATVDPSATVNVFVCADLVIEDPFIINSSVTIVGGGKTIYSSVDAMFKFTADDVALELNDITLTITGKVVGGYTDQAISTNIEAIANKLNAEGFSLVESNGVWTVTSANPEAAIAGWNYATLADAIAAAQDGDTIDLLRDLTVTKDDAKQDIAKSITVDGHNYTVTGNVSSGAAMRAVNGNVVIKNLTIEMATNSADPFVIKHVNSTYVSVTFENCHLISQRWGLYLYQVKDADITVTNSTIVSPKGGLYLNASTASVTLNGTSITTTLAGATSVEVSAVYAINNANVDLTVENNSALTGTVHGIYVKNSTLNLDATATTVNANTQGVFYVTSNGNVTLGTNAVVSSGAHGIRFNGSKVNVVLKNNASITTTANGAVYFAGEGDTDDKGSSLTVKDTVLLNGAKFDVYATGAALNVTYDFSGITNYKAYLFIHRTTPAHAYHFYNTLEDALTSTVDYQNEANVKNTVTLLDNVVDFAGVTPNKSVTINGNGKAITSSAAAAFTLSDKCTALALNNVTISTSGNLLAGYTNQTVTTNVEAVANKLNAEGYALELADGTWTIVSATPEAQINGWNYATLRKAIAAAVNGNTIELLTDVADAAGNIDIKGKDLTIHGNGKLVSTTKTTNNVIRVYDCTVIFENIRIKGARDGITLVSESADTPTNVVMNNVTINTDRYGICIWAVPEADSTLTITNTSISGGENSTATNVGGITSAGSLVTVHLKDNVTVTSTQYALSAMGAGNDLYDCCTYIIEKNVSLSGTLATIHASVSATDVVFNLENSKYVASLLGVHSNGKTRDINVYETLAEAITAPALGVTTNVVTLHENVTDFAGVTLTKDVIIEGNGYVIVATNVAFTLAEGTDLAINCEVDAPVILAGFNGQTVTTDKETVANKLNAQGYSLVKSNGIWTVTSSTPAAQINGWNYATIEEAIAAATEGDTILIVNNCVANNVVVNKVVTFNGNGKTISSTAEAAFKVQAEVTFNGIIINAAQVALSLEADVNVTVSGDSNVTAAGVAININGANPNVIIIGGSHIESTGSIGIEIVNSSPTLSISGTGIVTTVLGAADAIRIDGSESLPSISVSGNSIVKTTGADGKHLFNIINGAHPTINVSGNTLLATAHSSSVYGHAFRIGSDSVTANATIILSGSTAEDAAGIVINTSRLLDVRKASSVDFTVRGKVTVTAQHQVIYSNGGNGHIKFHVNATDASFKNLSSYNAFDLNTGIVDTSFVGNVKINVFDTARPAIVLTSTKGSTLLINGNAGNGFAVNNAANAIKVAAGTSDIDVLGKVDLNCSAEAIHIAAGTSDIVLNGTDIVVDGTKAIYVAQDNSKIAISGTVDLNCSAEAIHIAAGASDIALNGTNITITASKAIAVAKDNSKVVISGTVDIDCTGWAIDFNGAGNADLTITGNVSIDGEYGLVKNGSGTYTVLIDGDTAGNGVVITTKNSGVYYATSTKEGNTFESKGKVTFNSNVVSNFDGTLSFKCNATVTLGGSTRVLHTGGDGDTHAIRTQGGINVVINVKDNAYIESSRSIIEPEGAANVTVNISGGTLKTTGAAPMFNLTQTGTYVFNITGGTFNATADCFYMTGHATDLTLGAGVFNVKTLVSTKGVAPTITLNKGLTVTATSTGVYMTADVLTCQPTVIFNGVEMTAPRAVHIPNKFSDTVYNAVSPVITVKGESLITTTDWGFKVGDSGAGNAYEGHTVIDVLGGTIHFKSYGFTQNSTSKTGGTMDLNISGGTIYNYKNSVVYIDSDYVGTEYKNTVNMTGGTITFPEGNTDEGFGINVKNISQVAITLDGATIITNGKAIATDNASGATTGAKVKFVLKNSTITSNKQDAIYVSGIAGSTLEIYGCKIESKALNSFYDSQTKVTSYNVDNGVRAGLHLAYFFGNKTANTPDVIIGDYVAADGTVVKTEIKATGYESGKGLNSAVLLTDCADVDLSIGGSTELSTHTSEKTYAFRTLRTTASILFKDNAKFTSSTSAGWTIDFADNSTVSVVLTDNVTVTGKHTFVCNSGNIDLVLRGKVNLTGEDTALHFQTGTHTVKIVENASISKGMLIFKGGANGTVVIGNAEGYTSGKVVLNIKHLKFEGGASGNVTINGNTEINTTYWGIDFEGAGNGVLNIADNAVIHSTTYGIVRNGTGSFTVTMNGGKIITDADDAFYVDTEYAGINTFTLTNATIQSGYSGFYAKDVSNVEVIATNVNVTSGTSGWNFNSKGSQSLTIVGGTHIGNGTGNCAGIYMQGGGSATVNVTNATINGHFGFRINSDNTNVTANVSNVTFRTNAPAFQTNGIAKGTVSFYDCTFRNATNDWNSGCIYTTEWARFTLNLYDCDMYSYSGYNVQFGGGRYNDSNGNFIKGDETATVNIYGGTYHSQTSDAVVQTNRFAVANIYGGYFEAHNNTVLRPWDGSTLNVYGGFVYFNPPAVSYEGSCVRVAGGTANMPATANIYGGNFVNRANAGPVFNGINAERTLNLYGTDGKLITNANGKPAITAKGGNCLVNNPGAGTPTIKYQVSNQYFTGNAPVRVNGAQIRFGTDGNGIRFATTINKATVDYIKSLMDANTTVGYGTLILPTDYLEGGDLTTNKDNVLFNHYTLDRAGIKYLDIPAVAGLQIDGSGNVTLRAAITNLKETNYDRSFSAVGYIKYTVGGVVCYLYSNFDQFDNSRSMKQLAERALEDTYCEQTPAYRFPVGDGSYSRYTESQRETLLAYYNAETDNHKTVDLYLIAGQSNGSGYSTFNDAFLTQNEAFKNGFENVYFSGNSAGNSGGYQMPHVIDTTKVTAGFGRLENEIGAELGMAAILNQYYNAEEGNIAGIVKYSVGGTSLRDNVSGSDAPEGNWCSPSWIEMTLATGGSIQDANRTGALYYHFLNQVQNAIDQYKALGYDQINIKGMFWMQGESDRTAAYNHYANMLKYFINDIRVDLGELTGEDLSEMPFVVGAISESFGRDFNEGNTKFVELQYRLPQLLQDENIHVVNTSAVFATSANSGDSAHYTGDDMLMIGKTVGTTLANVYANEFGIEEPLAHPTTTGDMIAEVVVNGEVVARYNHLVYALNSAPAGATVRLLADAYVYAGAMNVANRNGSVTLDGNGFTIYSYSSYQAFRVIGCSLTLVNVNLVQNGTVTVPGASAVFHDAGSMLIVNGSVEDVVEVTLGDQTISKGLDAYYAINTAPAGATVKILADIDVYGDALNIRNTNAITIDGCNHTIAAIAVDDHTIDLFNTDLTMKNWNVVNREDQNDYHYALYFQTEGAKLTIESGSFDAYHHGVVANKAGNVLVINGGTFSNRQGRNGFDTPVYGNNAAIVTINGGEFNANATGTAFRMDGVATVTVNGGTFTTESGEYCIWINNADASLTIADATAVTFNGATVANVLNNGTGYQP